MQAIMTCLVFEILSIRSKVLNKLHNMLWHAPCINKIEIIKKEENAMTSTYLERILDPWREFERMNRLIDSSRNRENDFPAVNVWVNGEDAVITTEIPGISSKDINISVTGNTVTLKGARQGDERKESESYHRHELWNGNFSKTIKLPFNIDANKVNASYKKGILQIRLPQLEADKPRKINIS
jgi:HSP20 family protein